MRFLPRRRHFQRSRDRRLACPDRYQETVCQDILKSVWDIEWRPDAAHGRVPPTPYITFWEDCEIPKDEDDLSIDDDVPVNDRMVISAVITTVKGNLDCTLPELKAAIEGDYSTQDGSDITLTGDTASKVLAFAIHLWLHIEPSKQCFEGPSTETLASYLLKEIPEPLSSPTHSYETLSDDFCAKHLRRKGGFHLRWTSELKNHLSLAGNYIYVFRHANSLRALSRRPNSHPYPPEFIAETIETLNLLYRPRNDKYYRRNARQMDKHLDHDLELAMEHDEMYDLEKYPYWHARLVAIQNAYDKATPKNIQQWYFNRRDRVMWSTFWVAFVVFILTVIFGIAQTVTSIMQVYAAFNPAN